MYVRHALGFDLTSLSRKNIKAMEEEFTTPDSSSQPKRSVAKSNNVITHKQ
jgi:hypothetical protein